jgi:dCMP deaminase
MENGSRTVKDKHKLAHMKAAFAYAECSTAVRLQVGCVIVKDNRVISIGYNGMPSGWTNECETQFMTGNGTADHVELITKPEVLHAESNAIAKLARCSESGEGASAFITHQPCMECAKLLYQSGIKQVYYVQPYRLDAGLKFLQECNIPVEQIDV